MADLVKLTIDGKAVEAPAGTLLIDAAKRAGLEIPAFCYYEGLSLQAACRMCLVEVEKAPKLMAACTLPVTEGMVVKTDTPIVHQARKSTLEFLLTNHPLDCPVCDKGGECELQDMVFRYGAGESRFTEIKVHEPERQWSPVVFYDPARCILCYRCVRICNEGMGVGALGVTNRGVVSEIVPSHGDHLECDECGMCIDICPVGALTSGTYRYKARPWEMNHVGTICTHCSNGCKTTLGVRNDHILRGNNRDQSGINGEFLCIKGRYAFDFTDNPDRLTSPMMRNASGQLEAVSWSRALLTVAKKFAEIKAKNGKFGVIGSNHTTNEENYALQKFARQGLGTANIDHHRTGDVATLLDAISGQTNALATTADLYNAKAALVVGSDLAQQHPFLAYQLRANYRHHMSHVYVVTPGVVREDKYATKSVRVIEGQEFPALEQLRDTLKAEPELIILYGDTIKGDRVRQLVEFGSSLGIPVKYVALVDYSNSRGAADMGLTPDLGPGYHAADQRGMTLTEMLGATDLDALWVVGANPLRRKPLNSKNAFVVVQDLFLTETAQRADVIFPAGSAYEKNGTVTNVTGEVQSLTSAIRVMGSKPDLEIFSLLAKEMGLDLGILKYDKVFDEIRRTVRGYNVSLPVIATGGAAQTTPVNGRVPVDSQPELIQSARDTLFTSGSLGRYSPRLNSVLEAPGALYDATSDRLVPQGGLSSPQNSMEFIILSLIKAGVVAAVLLTTLAYLQWVERKVLAHIQLRLGPQRVGPHGLFQPIADVVKLLTKEDLLPPYVNRFFYLLAPFLAVSLSLVAISVIPFGPEVSVFGYRTWLQLTDLDVGILFILAISSVSVYGVALAGWASNNKYSLLGGMRSSAQMISYELPLAMAIAAPLLIDNTLSLRQMVIAQSGTWHGIPQWNVFALPFPQIISFIIFVIAGFAETNRVPFDLPEAENELVAGFHTEYSSMKFASFFMAEYANIITITCVATTLFLGGWTPLWPAEYGSNFVPVILFALAGAIALFHGLQPARKWDKYTLPAAGLIFFAIAAVFLIPILQPILIPVFWFAFKTGTMLFVFIWIRGTLPRFRYDQLMRFAWTFLFPCALLNLLATSLMVSLFPNR